jgi:hypothetical protein
MKMLKKQSNKAQSAVEYAVAFMVVVASLISIGFIANAKGIFQNHFGEAAGKVSSDSGSAGAVNTAASNLQFLIQNGDGADFNQAAGMYDDNPAQVLGDLAAVDNNATIASTLGTGTSDGDEYGSLTPEEQYEIAQEGYALAQENLSYAQTGVTVAENRMNQAYASWQQAEDQYDYWCQAYEDAKEAYDNCWGGETCAALYSAMQSAQSNKIQARQTADDLKDEYDQRVIEHEWSLEVLDTAVDTANQAYQDMLDAEAALSA